MTAALVAALKKIGIKIATEIAADPSKIIKYLLLTTGLPIFIILLMFSVPAFLFLNIPSILFDSASASTSSNSANVLQNLSVVALYQDAPIVMNESINNWIETQKTTYPSDDFVIENSYFISWQMIMSIDAIRFNQDFSSVTSQTVLDLCNTFAIYNVRSETYEAEEEYLEEVKSTRTVIDSKGKKTIVPYSTWEVKTRTITKTRTYISISSKLFNNVLTEFGFDDAQKEIATSMYFTLNSIDIEGNLNLYDDVDLTNLKEYPPGSANIVYFNQCDVRWGAESYGSSSIKSGGCGPTSLSMVVYSLAGRTDVDPKVIADWSVANGHRAEGSGSYWSLMTAGGSYFGLSVEAVSRQDPDTIVQALSNGYPIIVSMGRGHFTNGGHFIVLRGLTQDGKILVNDPYSVKNTEKAWDLSIIMNESSINGGVNGSPFWIFRK